MTLPRYIDIHKHIETKEEDEDVLNVYNKHELFDSMSATSFCSVGIHPWYIEEGGKQMEALKKASRNHNVIAIGECGLDAIRGVPLELQTFFFEAQIQLANEVNKPLVIHCVRAFSQVLALLKKAIVPVIFHGFDKRLTIAAEVLSHGYYLSFGAALLNETSAAATVFSSVPMNRFFLETDDKLVAIRDVYNAAAGIRKKEEDAIILQVQENFKNVFKL